ncbi:MAG: type I addiction module toxin, SymE family [Gammaproteobacteria bacterium]|nr:type I addiction module toxin, SymE family [Gammaproteobacteria bacterium]
MLKCDGYIRYLKVRERHRDYSLKNKPYQGNPTTPFLFLKGTWLEKAGFTIDMLISVTVHKNCLLIVPNENV